MASNTIDTFSTKCTGCGACSEVCPTAAITMVENAEGFLVPYINTEKCIKCGKCFNTCPINQDLNKNTPECYATIISDENVRKNSASGGTFIALAKWILENDGYVCGAIYNENFEVEHILTNKFEDVLKMQSSKYVQSNLKDNLSKIGEYLKQEKVILFVGTPCQVAGLKSYLRTKKINDYNLYTCDLICFGVPSPKVFKKCLAEFVPNDEKILKINMRKKVNKKSCYSILTDKQEYCFPHTSNDTRNLYIKLFFKHVSLRKSCAECKFTNTNRVGDLTLGDFWEIQKYDRRLNPHKGINCILVNNEKGKQLLLKNKKQFSLFKKVPLQVALNGQPRLQYPTEIPEQKRKDFFENLDKMSIEENFNRVIGDKSDCKIINYWFAVNYGAALTCYALKRFIEKQGYSVKTINYIEEVIAQNRDFYNSKVKLFAEKYLNLTSESFNYSSLLKLNQNTDFFVVGSDQVFRPGLYKKHGGEIYQFNFVDNNKKKIAFSASFGTDKFDGDNKDKKIFKQLIERFTAISVREKQGLKILNDEFGINNCEHILDPVFTLEEEDLNLLTKDFSNNMEKYVGVFKYSDLHKDWCKSFEKEVGKNLNLNVKEYKYTKECDIEGFVAHIQNCEILITDSFHAACFAILFKKPFVILGLAKKAISRMNSLIETFKLDKNILIKTSEIESKPFEEKAKEIISLQYDYNKVQDILNFEKQKMVEWFLQSLNNTNCITGKPDESDFSKIIKTAQQREKEHQRKTFFKLLKKLPKTLVILIVLKTILKIYHGDKRSIILEKKQKHSNRLTSFRKIFKNIYRRK